MQGTVDRPTGTPSSNEAADVLSLTSASLLARRSYERTRRLVLAGKVRSSRTPTGRLRVSRSSLLEYLAQEAREVAGPPVGVGGIP